MRAADREGIDPIRDARPGDPEQSSVTGGGPLERKLQRSFAQIDPTFATVRHVAEDRWHLGLEPSLDDSRTPAYIMRLDERGIVLDKWAIEEIRSHNDSPHPSYYPTPSMPLGSPQVTLKVNNPLPIVTVAPDAFHGKRLRLARIVHGFTVEALADRSKVSSRYIRKLEHGGRQPIAEMTAALAESLNVQPGFFLIAADGWEESPLPECRRIRRALKRGLFSADAHMPVATELVVKFDRMVNLPTVLLSAPLPNPVESAARIRTPWELGPDVPIASMTRALGNHGSLPSRSAQ